jgi:hypothetical protein
LPHAFFCHFDEAFLQQLWFLSRLLELGEQVAHIAMLS